jgi:excisionase family DNA binding protein
MSRERATIVEEQAQPRRQEQRSADRLAWPITEGAHRIGVGRSTIYKLAAEGKIRLIKVAGRRLIPEEEIARLVSGEHA